MTNPTTPFSWQMPTASDLVTDLPADFETFGQAVATSMADLLGGTTGQVLSKASNTDMDFTWVTSDDANAIQNTIVDAKGDLIAATAADTPARLAVGTNGQVLTADSTAATGLAWATAASGGMTLLATHTLSGATSTISSISGAYKQLVAYIELPQNATADGNFRIAPNGDTNLAYLVGVKIATTVYDVNGGYITTNSSSFRTTTNFSATLVIDNYTTTATTKPVQFYGWYSPSSGTGTFMSSGIYAGASAVTSLVFSNSGGNLSGGTVYLYGVK